MGELGLFKDLQKPEERYECKVAIPGLMSCRALATSFRHLADQLDQQGDRMFTKVRPERETRMIVVDLAEVNVE